mgnify:CR=1 FL=1
MGDASDIEQLLGRAKHDILVRRLWAAARLAFVMGSAFAGAAWTARGYLEQLATKDDVAKLLRGQDEKIGQLQASLQTLGDRQTRTETRVDDMRGTMKVRP